MSFEFNVFHRYCTVSKLGVKVNVNVSIILVYVVCSMSLLLDLIIMAFIFCSSGIFRRWGLWSTCFSSYWILLLLLLGSLKAKLNHGVIVS